MAIVGLAPKIALPSAAAPERRDETGSQKRAEQQRSRNHGDRVSGDGIKCATEGGQLIKGHRDHLGRWVSAECA